MRPFSSAPRYGRSRRAQAWGGAVVLGPGLARIDAASCAPARTTLRETESGAHPQGALLRVSRPHASEWAKSRKRRSFSNADDVRCVPSRPLHGTAAPGGRKLGAERSCWDPGWRELMRPRAPLPAPLFERPSPGRIPQGPCSAFRGRTPLSGPRSRKTRTFSNAEGASPAD